MYTHQDDYEHGLLAEVLLCLNEWGPIFITETHNVYKNYSW